MTDLSRVFMVLGAVLFLAGASLFLLGKLGIGKLPGDIFLQKGHFSFYFPLTTSVLLSIILSVIFIICSKK